MPCCDFLCRSVAAAFLRPEFLDQRILVLGRGSASYEIFSAVYSPTESRHSKREVFDPLTVCTWPRVEIQTETLPNADLKLPTHRTQTR